MNPGARGTTASAEQTFGRIARDVFSLDPGIRWAALEQAGREPRWAWRDPETSRLYVGTTSAEFVDPLKLMLAEGRDDLCGHVASTNPHHLLFVALAYTDSIQIVARFGPDANMRIATDRSVDVLYVGDEARAPSTSRRSRTPSSVNAHGHVPTRQLQDVPVCGIDPRIALRAEWAERIGPCELRKTNTHAQDGDTSRVDLGLRGSALLMDCQHRTHWSICDKSRTAAS